MNDQLWTSAKHIAQSDGRKDDWFYIVDIYKSIGGKSVALLMYGEGGFQCEVVGEISPTEVLISKNGELEVIERSLLKKARKKFIKRDTEKYEVIHKAFEHNSEIYPVMLYIERG